MVAVGAVCENACQALEAGIHGGQVENLDVAKGPQAEAHDIAMVAASVLEPHEVAVGAIREAVSEAREASVLGGHVKDLDVTESPQVKARNFARVVVSPCVRHNVAIGAVREAASEALQVGVCGAHVEELDVAK